MEMVHVHPLQPASHLPYEAVNRLHELAHEDVVLIVQVYQMIQQVQTLWLSTADEPDLDLLRQHLAVFAQADFIADARSIGFSTLEVKEDTPALHHLFHELRGGCLASLVLYVNLMQKRPNHPHYLIQAIHFAQNHLLTMQYLLPDLLQVERLSEK